MTRFKYYSNYLACLLGTLIAFELCWIGAKYVIEGEVVHTYDLHRRRPDPGRCHHRKGGL